MGISVVRQLLSFVQGSRTILSVHPRMKNKKMLALIVASTSVNEKWRPSLSDMKPGRSSYKYVGVGRPVETRSGSSL